MADIVLANELYIEYDGTQIACTTDFTLNIERAEINVNCSQFSWAANLAGSKSWNLDFSAIVKRNDTNSYLIYNDLMTEIIISDIPVTIALKSSISGDTYYQGQATLINLTQTGTIDDKVTYSGTLEGYGQLAVFTGDNDSFPYTFPYQLA